MSLAAIAAAAGAILANAPVSREPVVDGVDLTTLLGSWGTSNNDITGDGLVSGPDLARLLNLIGDKDPRGNLCDGVLCCNGSVDDPFSRGHWDAIRPRRRILPQGPLAIPKSGPLDGLPMPVTLDSYIKVNGRYYKPEIGDKMAKEMGSRAASQAVQAGEVVLMDCGCTVEDYQSDISRSWIHDATPTPQQRAVWNDVARGQAIAIEAARLGVPAGAVDDAVRAFYEQRGYGPGYKLPGLSHRTGHGIGMEGHEPVNLVHGETTPLDVGMCFSNEPGLYLPGVMGIRMEDCFHMTPQGPAWFSHPPASIEAPIG